MINGRTAKIILLIIIIISLTSLVFAKSIQNIISREKINSQENNLSIMPVEKSARLKIPIINVDSAIEYLGLTNGGAVDTPKNLINVAWFNLGPSPGEIGSAVIVGHHGLKNAEPGVFTNLYKLRKGDKLYIENADGSKINFIVRESKTYLNSSSAAELFTSNDLKAHLNLVTCSGIWDEINKSYSDRLVVFTDKE